MSDYYDRRGSPISAGEWSLENNRVERTETDAGEVSTIYLGLDHSFGSPLIFETMIFGGLRDQETWRYTTEAQAREGHARAVQLLRADENSRGIDGGVYAAQK